MDIDQKGSDDLLITSSSRVINLYNINNYGIKLIKRYECDKLNNISLLKIENGVIYGCNNGVKGGIVVIWDVKKEGICQCVSVKENGIGIRMGMKEMKDHSNNERYVVSENKKQIVAINGDDKSVAFNEIDDNFPTKRQIVFVKSKYFQENYKSITAVKRVKDQIIVIVYAGKNGITKINIIDNKEEEYFIYKDDNGEMKKFGINAIVIWKDKYVICSSRQSSVIRVLNIENKEVISLKGHKSFRVCCLLIIKDDILVSGGNENERILWDLKKILI